MGPTQIPGPSRPVKGGQPEKVDIHCNKITRYHDLPFFLTIYILLNIVIPCFLYWVSAFQRDRDEVPDDAAPFVRNKSEST